MQGRLLYIGTPGTAVEPIIQVTNGDKAILTSIRLSAPTNNNATFRMYHLEKGETTINTNQALAYDFQVSSKSAVEFLTHPLPVSPGEAIWVAGNNLALAIYGVTFP